MRAFVRATVVRVQRDTLMREVDEVLRKDRGDGVGRGRTYLAVCTSDDYLEGLVVLEQSLRRVGSAYPLTVLVTQAVSDRTVRTLNRLGMRTARSRRSLAVPNEVLERNAAFGREYWSRTFDKLQAFELHEFSKVVYLDSDMLVLRNVDDLFDRPHMSAVAAGRGQPGNESWDRLNSGCLVIVPAEDALDHLWGAVPVALREREAIGDQDLLQISYPDWPDRQDLHLGEEYNLFFIYLEHYTRELGYSLRGENPIKIVHFVGAVKPWDLTSSGTARMFARHLRARQWDSLAVLARYQRMLIRARLRMATTPARQGDPS